MGGVVQQGENIDDESKVSIKVTSTGQIITLSDGLIGDSSNRIIASAKAVYAAATNSCSFTESENTRQVQILCTAVGVATSDYVRMVLDPGTEAVANAWFNDVGGIAIPVEPDEIPYNKLITVSFPSYITELHFKPSVDSTHIGVSAVGV